MVETVGKLRNLAHITSTTMKRDALLEKFKTKIAVNPALDRALVSFQANKHTPFYSWFKYKEGFSESLVTYLLQYLQRQPGVLLDPFSGASSSLFAASSLGWQAKGIEVLPVGIYASKARFVVQEVDIQELRNAIYVMKQVNFLDYYTPAYELRHIVITNGAFPVAEQQQLVGYIAYCHCHIPDENLRTLLLFAAFCVLEPISYTRKDGQYLRWDVRSGRSQGKKIFNKGYIYPFREAIHEKLSQILFDLEINPTQVSLFDKRIDKVFQQQDALQEILACLETYREQGQLNNLNIVKMVRNYFYEMCFVIYEMARMLKPGGNIIMVNDNVRYAGEEVPVDLILSDIAESFGLNVKHIWTLERGKGNSSQQMGNHGRSELRKCVYVWEKSLGSPKYLNLLSGIVPTEIAHTAQ